MVETRLSTPCEAINGEILLKAYSIGIFPMAESADDGSLYWVSPRMRGILPLDSFHASRSLKRRIRNCGFSISVDRNFEGVISGCADRPETWISNGLRALFLDLHAAGHAHSIEINDREQRLVGGLYGLSIGGAFFAESMFSRVTDASKIALAYLVARLQQGKYSLLDVQFVTPHLEAFGAIEIPAALYRQCLTLALARNDADFFALPEFVQPSEIVQRITQTS